MNEATLQDLVLRLGLALVAGLVLGYEREQHGRAAGMRTTMLVCVASAVVMLLSQHLFVASSAGGESWRPDPARLAAGVLAGMGFLGAGVIIQQENSVYGVTTAAVLWFSAILGMAFGAGYIALALVGFGIALLALFILPGVEARMRSDRYARLEVRSALAGPSKDAIKVAVHAAGLVAELKSVSLEVDQKARQRIMVFSVKTKSHKVLEAQTDSVNRVARMKGVLKVRWY